MFPFHSSPRFAVCMNPGLLTGPVSFLLGRKKIFHEQACFGEAEVSVVFFSIEPQNERG